MIIMVVMPIDDFYGVGYLLVVLILIGDFDSFFEQFIYLSVGIL